MPAGGTGLMGHDLTQRKKDGAAATRSMPAMKIPNVNDGVGSSSGSGAYKAGQPLPYTDGAGA
jgi:hypothetical protein